MLNWKKVVELNNIPVLGSRVFRTENKEIAIFRCRDDSVFAIHNSCPHQQGKLSEGIVHGHSVTCPLHNWVINLKDGQAQGADEGQVGCVKVKVEDNTVYIDLG